VRSWFIDGRKVLQSVAWLVTLTVLTILPGRVAEATPQGPAIFCATYPQSPSCQGTLVTCSHCHTSTSPSAPAWNSYGIAVLSAGYQPPFETGVAAVLPLIEDLDSDQDGVSNLDEITVGSAPGDAHSVLVEKNPPAGPNNPTYQLGEYDHRFAFRRVMLVYCGRSATWEENQSFAATPDPYQALHDQLDACLETNYWQDYVLARLADPAIRPIDFGSAWQWDYRLFRYVMSGDRDMRELLLADYHVRELNGELFPVVGPISHDTGLVCDPEAPEVCDTDQHCIVDAQSGVPTCRYLNGGQPLTTAHRAGMITSAWFHFYNTMFALLPRQTAAQAYRAYLGQDIARQQGILPVSGEPIDYDEKGVTQAECAQCHSTLDPLSYAFAYYNGIGGTGPPSQYDANRPETIGLWTATDSPQAYVLGEEVVDLVDWAQTAASSEPFMRQMTRLFYEHVIGHAPYFEDLPEFTALWMSLPTDNYSANKLNHRLIDLMAFGGP
jgi:hypothetical protein